MSLLPGVVSVYVQRADESLSKHRRDPAGMCDWCAAVWRRQVAYPCFAARIAIAVKETYAVTARGRHSVDNHESRANGKDCEPC